MKTESELIEYFNNHAKPYVYFQGGRPYLNSNEIPELRLSGSYEIKTENNHEIVIIAATITSDGIKDKIINLDVTIHAENMGIAFYSTHVYIKAGAKDIKKLITKLENDNSYLRQQIDNNMKKILKLENVIIDGDK